MTRCSPAGLDLNHIGSACLGTGLAEAFSKAGFACFFVPKKMHEGSSDSGARRMDARQAMMMVP